MSRLLRCGPAWLLCALLVSSGAAHHAARAGSGQPLAANVRRVVQALDLLGAPLPSRTLAAIRGAGEDAVALRRALADHVLVNVQINPESRVKAARGAARAELQQSGYRPFIVRIDNEAGVTAPLRAGSPQAGPVYAGVAELSMQRQRQLPLLQNQNVTGSKERFLQLRMLDAPPLTPNLSGLEQEYAVILIHASVAGRREAVLSFDVGQGSQDLGFRAEVPVLFNIRPAIPVRLRIRDFDGQPSVARLTFSDEAGHVYPPQPGRLAPDFFFQQHIYRPDGGTVLLPPGAMKVSWSRGPEYLVQERTIRVPAKGPSTLSLDLKRWIHPAKQGYYSGDHHIHGAGCAHYTLPTEGVFARDMFWNVKGEGLNVGSVLTWGPCFDFQRQFFSPMPDAVSEPLTVIKYDLEVSGFGSQALGHVCLLNLKDQTYPGSDGTKTKGWPTWTTPLMRWAKAQGAVTGYAHSASGLEIIPKAAAGRLMTALDANRDSRLTPDEAERGLLPEEFGTVDADRDGGISMVELESSHARAAERLPNLAIPEMNGVGAMETCVTVAHNLCDFISAMDTPRIQEWNTWYHLLNCGFPLKVSGETDFPCMSGSRVGQGRVYVRLGPRDRLDYAEWCRGLAEGRSYVSDGYAHALDFTVNGLRPGDILRLNAPGEVQVRADVAFGAQIPVDTAYGTSDPAGGRRLVGDTVNRHEPLHDGRTISPGTTRRVELVVNGLPAASVEVPADGATHPVQFRIPIRDSSWVALRHFPQLHTNPVNVLVGRRPIRASRRSALWCIGVIEQLWRNRERAIAPAERDEARKTFDAALEIYREIARQTAAMQANPPS